MSGPVRVVLVRPWSDRRGGAGCCGGDAAHGVCLERPSESPGHDDSHLLGETYRRLRTELGDRVDVQVASAGNTAYLVPSSFLAVRRRQGLWAGVRAALSSTAHGAVLVDGERIGDLDDLGADGVLKAVAVRLGQAPLGTT